jgi:hypothetical protein
MHVSHARVGWPPGVAEGWRLSPADLARRVRCEQMSESPLHRDLGAYLISHIAMGEAAITHVAGRIEHPDPYAIGRHEPDILALTEGGVLVIGEAKTEPDLEELTAQEQIADFSRAIGPNGEKATFWLCVPAEYGDAAQAAIEAHADQHYRVGVVTVAGLSPAVQS